MGFDQRLRYMSLTILQTPEKKRYSHTIIIPQTQKYKHCYNKGICRVTLVHSCLWLKSWSLCWNSNSRISHHKKHLYLKDELLGMTLPETNWSFYCLFSCISCTRKHRKGPSPLLSCCLICVLCIASCAASLQLSKVGGVFAKFILELLLAGISRFLL